MRQAFISVETLDNTELVNPKPEPVPSSATLQEVSQPTSRGWLKWTIVVGIAVLALVGTAEWVLGLLARIPVLGAPAAIGAGLVVIGLVSIALREVRALRRLRDVQDIRDRISRADGDELKELLLSIGSQVDASATARRAVNLIEDQGPDAARRLMSREALNPLDRRAAQAVGISARQGFVMVTASPSPALDSALLLVRAARLVREIASIYGYRPSTLAIRSLAFAAGKDAGAVAVANALAEAAASAASRTIAKGGDAVSTAGLALTASGAGALIGLPMAAAGLGLSLVGRSVGVAGGAVGGGTMAAWRLYRFGLMVLTAARPLPFDSGEIADLSREARREIMKLSREEDAKASTGVPAVDGSR